MRLVYDTLIAVMLAAILAAVLIHYRHEDRQGIQVQGIQQSLARLQEQVFYHGALGEVTIAQNGFPREVSPLWFADNVPFNTLVPGRQPWLDVAPEQDDGDQPPDPVIRRQGQAGFWYNPNRGIFRARVAPQFTEAATIDLYNRMNGTSLADLTERYVPPPSPDSETAEVPTRPSEADHLATPEATVPPVAHKLPTLRDQDP